MDLSAAEIRVLGCLLEKQRTTPDHYPLSLNSLRLACNQATNREPVVDYDDAIVRDALHRLERRGYTRLAGASRAAKYRHLLSEALPMSSAEQAVMCVLMLRGPQTPGELKQRGERIHAFAGLDEVHATLAALIERDLVAPLGRRPGQKEDRYTQLLGDSDSLNGSTVATGTSVTPAVEPTATYGPMICATGWRAWSGKWLSCVRRAGRGRGGGASGNRRRARGSGTGGERKRGRSRRRQLATGALTRGRSSYRAHRGRRQH